MNIGHNILFVVVNHSGHAATRALDEIERKGRQGAEPAPGAGCFACRTRKTVWEGKGEGKKKAGGD
jgi:hypothetical protein